jgi:type I restriction enzyme S subunit
VHFIDRETARIDTLIAKKTRFIELLKEKRSALITHAVTKGLDPNVRIKDSGMEWIGKVPEHWNVTRLKHLGTLKGGAGFPLHLQGQNGNELPFYKVSDLAKSINGVNLGQTDNTITYEQAKALGATVFPAGTLAWAKLGAALFRNRRRITLRPCCLDNNMTGFTVNHAIASELCCYYLMSILDFSLHARPGAVPSFSEGDQGELTVPRPPHTEQELIATVICDRAARIDTLIAKVQRSIDLLKERRSAFITAAVTG